MKGIKLPKEFELYHKNLLREDFREFFHELLSHRTRLSVRVNTLKSDMREVKRVLSENNIGFGQVPWCRDGLWVDYADLNMIEHQLGYYYIQSASSMVAPQLFPPNPGSVLDLCSAPGGKTTHIAQLMENKGTVVANEHVAPRIRALVYNIQRMGVTNALVVKGDGVRFKDIGERFDCVLVDAPCSGVGTLKTSREALTKFSRQWISKLSGLQKKLILSGFDCLNPGGTLVYTTCTTTLEENEHVVEYLMQERADAQVERVKLEGLPARCGLTAQTAGCVRIYPQDTGTEPHFISFFTKDGD